MKSSVSIQVPINLFALGEGEYMKDYVNSLEPVVRKTWNHVNAMKLKLN